jgi:hypothetical protein
MGGRNERGNAFDNEGNFDIEETIEGREGCVQYTAPGAGQKWKARDLVDIHWELSGFKCPVSYCRIMSCIIDHANPKSGVCNPKQAVVAIETGYSDRTVRSALTWWAEQGFLRTESRGHSIALAYHPQWDFFEMHWVAVTAEIEADKEELRDRLTVYPGEAQIFSARPTGSASSGGTGKQSSGGTGSMSSGHEPLSRTSK